MVPWAAVWFSVFWFPICYFWLAVGEQIDTLGVVAVALIVGTLFGMMVAIPTSFLAMSHTVDIYCGDRRFVKWIVDWRMNLERYDTLTVQKSGLLYGKSRNPTLVPVDVVVEFRGGTASITGPWILVNGLARTFQDHQIRVMGGPHPFF